MKKYLDIVPEKNGGKNPPYVQVGIYSLVVNVTLVAVKLSLSFITGSLALRADAVHSAVDVFGSIALIIGLIMANRKTSKFPFGLYKVENVVSVIISLLLFVTAYEIVSEAVKGETSTVPYSGWVLAVAGALILVPFLFSRYEIKAGRRYNSPSLVADGKQFRADVLSASIVFFALLAQYFGFPLDRIAAGIIAVFIVYAGWGLLSDSMRVLLDASVDRETLERIRSIIESEPAVSTVNDIRGRNSGRYMFVEANINMRINDLTKAHQVSSRLEKKIKEEECCVDRVLIHYEPEEKHSTRYIIPVTDPEGSVSSHFGESPRFLLLDWNNKQKEVTKREVIDNPYLSLKKGKGIKITRFLLDYNPDVVFAKESLSGKGPGYAFAEAGVETRRTDKGKVDELVDELPSGSKDPHKSDKKNS